jgi:hypothetical protein
MIYSGAGPLPRHVYCYVQPYAFGNEDWLRVAWFGLVSHPGRTWGCHVMLECGAVYRNVPLHQLTHKITTTSLDWKPSDSQTGKYMFTAIPMLDGFSLEPEQSKEFYFIKLDNGRFTAQPTNHILVQDKSFITTSGWPRLERQTETWSVDP